MYMHVYSLNLVVSKIIIHQVCPQKTVNLIIPMNMFWKPSLISFVRVVSLLSSRVLKPPAPHLDLRGPQS